MLKNVYILQLVHGQLKRQVKVGKESYPKCNQNLSLPQNAYFFEVIKDALQRYIFEQHPQRVNGKEEENEQDKECDNPKKNQAQSACAESANKAVN